MYSLHVVPRNGGIARGRPLGSLFIRAALIAMIAVLCATVVKPTTAYATTPPPPPPEGAPTEELCEPLPEGAPIPDEPVYGICEGRVMIQDPALEQMLDFPAEVPEATADLDTRVSVEDLERSMAALRSSVSEATGGNFDVGESSHRANLDSDLSRTAEVITAYNNYNIHRGGSGDVAEDPNTVEGQAERFEQTLTFLTQRVTECGQNCLYALNGHTYRYLIVPTLIGMATSGALYGTGDYGQNVFWGGVSGLVAMQVASFLYAHADSIRERRQQNLNQEAARINSQVAADVQRQMIGFQRWVSGQFDLINTRLSQLDERVDGIQGAVNRLEQTVEARAQDLQNAQGDENESFRSSGTEYETAPADYDNGEL